jgi:ArsR family transcriptional regulator
MDRYSAVFKALSDKTRLRIMAVLCAAKKELCICEIMDVLGLAQYNVSKHVRELKIAGLVREKRAGRFVFYSLCAPEDDFHRYVLQAVSAMKDNEIAGDTVRLRKRLQQGRIAATRLEKGCCND